MSIDQPQGWIWQPDEVESYVATLDRPVFGVSATDLTDSGKGKTVLLYQAQLKVAGFVPNRRQTVGDCVSQAAACCIDTLKAVEIYTEGQNEEWRNVTATEPLYAYSRVEVGGGRLGNGDGSIGAWMAKAVKQGGTIDRGKYGNIDLTNYSGKRARDWGRRGKGCPDSLEPSMRNYPANICSRQGFSKRRDNQGFAKPSGTWAHAMAAIGCRDDGRPGILIQNSWGGWNSGGKWPDNDMPTGSFWVDADVIDKMCRSMRDSFVYSDFEGYPAKDVSYLLI
jgi:hypothetical protein